MLVGCSEFDISVFYFVWVQHFKTLKITLVMLEVPPAGVAADLGHLERPRFGSLRFRAWG